MDNKLTGKVALVTGAGRGIGRSIALSLAAEGASVIAAARNQAGLDQVCTEISEQGSSAVPVVFDLMDETSITALVEKVKSEFGRLDILINNAGLTHSASLEETTTEAFDRVMSTNARGPFILMRQCLPILKKSNRGFIINISSIVGIKGYPQQSAYTASKHALRGMSISLSEELKDTNIRIHVLCPGGVDTDMVSRVRPDIPKDALIHPDEIAELVLYLVTHQGNAVVDEIRIRRAASGPWF